MTQIRLGHRIRKGNLVDMGGEASRREQAANERVVSIF